MLSKQEICQELPSGATRGCRTERVLCKDSHTVSKQEGGGPRETLLRSWCLIPSSPDAEVQLGKLVMPMHP